MIAAMMLPTTFPLLAMFRRITGVTPHEYRGRCLHAAAAPRAEGMDGSR